MVTPFIPLPNGIKLTFVFVLFGKPVTFTIYVTTAEPIDTAVLAQAANRCVIWWNASGRGLLSEDIVLQRVEAFDVSVQDGAFAVLPVSVDASGSVPSRSLPANAAVVVSQRTGRIGRSYRGRTYLPGIPEAVVTGNSLDGAYRALVVGSFNALRAELLEGGFTHVIASYQNENAPRVIGEATAVQGSIVNDRIDTQRRRLPR